MDNLTSTEKGEHFQVQIWATFNDTLFFPVKVFFAPFLYLLFLVEIYKTFKDKFIKFCSFRLTVVFEADVIKG